MFTIIKKENMVKQEMAKDEQRSKILTVSVALREQIYRNAINEIQSYPAPPQLATKTDHRRSKL
jgi:hypothetical protein